MPEHIDALNDLRRKYPSWSVQLTYDNLKVMQFEAILPSYSSILRYLKSIGYIPHYSLNKTRKLKEIRSFEVEFVGQMWHMDFHKGSRMVINEKGEFVQPICAAFIDDKSRLICHAQWFLNETTEVLVHSLIQAIMKRGIPRTFYTDNGSAMKGEELKYGLENLGIKHETTLPYSPHQNGKQESFWQPLEGRLMKMIPKDKRISLDVLNRLTQAWIEQDYHDTIHSEIKEKPVDRFFNSSSVLRPALEFEELKSCFRTRIKRNIRKTDGTVTIDGVRFEVPQVFRHMDELVIKYARWDLGEAEIISPTTFKSLFKIFPIDRLSNSKGARKILTQGPDALENAEPSGDKKSLANNTPILDITSDSLPPLLAKCLEKHSREFSNSGYLAIQNRGSENE